MKLVRQKHARGCGVAALAMLTGDDYDAVAVYFRGIDLDAKGLYLCGLDDYLVDRGYAIARKKRYLGFFGGDGAPPREPWPPAPFADVHLCEVEVYEKAPVYHFVVMLRDGAVLDPLADGPRRLSDYHRVNSVAGVYRVGADPCTPSP